MRLGRLALLVLVAASVLGCSMPWTKNQPNAPNGLGYPKTKSGEPDTWRNRRKTSQSRPWFLGGSTEDGPATVEEFLPRDRPKP